eukprot:TRINITY_DN14401_c1_g3_i6.p1 TRINITY_DN14401_c1_g3~~TRINITY_DN14401_c1_g3_i6.p1  ORF type:complete len:412 (-),score=60.49 TRINITY_DN14401_c1_g3_i6:92-1327(-)
MATTSAGASVDRPWLPAKRARTAASTDQESSSTQVPSHSELSGPSAAASSSSSPPAASGWAFPDCALTFGCRGVQRYRKLNRIDEGTYGVVYRACDTETGEIVALKQLKVNAAKSEDGFPISSLREISLLLKFSHPNIVRCREVVMGNTSNHIFMVMEYVEHELKVLIGKHSFAVADMKCLLLQILSAVGHLHERWVVHRDLKTTNILLNSSGVLKVCDFGLARHIGDPLRPYTQRVQSLWYRAPELLLGARRYTGAVDVWSVGCIFAELILRRPVFEGKAEVHQLGLIFALTGVPNEESWPGCEKLSSWKLADSIKTTLPRWRVVFPEEGNLSDVGLEMLQSLLECCPEHRSTAPVAREHPYFSESPQPHEPGMMPTFQDSNTEGRRQPTSTVVRRPSFLEDQASMRLSG